MVSTKKRVSIGLTDEQYKLVDDLAKSRGFSKSAIFVLALEEYVKKQIEKGKDK
ncbi:TPA: CopG family transcriptional regulator [Staphylococcus aureus]|nr:CopG family transcriptional regulator [Staphylococcus aureus]HBI9248684.1 CopG family transcriptional regulator [Staphylococcus aureus]HDB3102138.1 CopG family transcriptional regulator [Staphylococcus aureus]HDB3110416.1 CopG family transcriptional regulator [Staphylococcus aureus]HDB3591631.1 CopG family transcriptional regulator [Staphylococcus aureus]